MDLPFQVSFIGVLLVYVMSFVSSCWFRAQHRGPNMQQCCKNCGFFFFWMEDGCAWDGWMGLVMFVLLSLVVLCLCQEQGGTMQFQQQSAVMFSVVVWYQIHSEICRGAADLEQK